ncbi:MAG: alkaline phosphatase family protein [Candidatus Omnitrophota bacterium]
MYKIIYVVLDGLGDSSIPELDNRTPLEAARTPDLDYLASCGQLGSVYTVGEKVAPESDVAVISIIGYDADKYYTGRGPLESHAEGLKINDGDLAYRVNFATLGKGSNEILDRRVGRDLSTPEAVELAEELNAKVKLKSIPGASFEFKSTIGHRGVLVLRAQGNLSANVSNTDPAYGKKGVFGIALEKFDNVLLECRPLDHSKAAKDAAHLTNEFIKKSRKILENSGVNRERDALDKRIANVILTRDAGDHLPKFPTMKELFDLNFGCFVEMPVEKGIAMLTGMREVASPPKTGKIDEDYLNWAKKVITTKSEFDGLYIHIKGPDEPAHDGDYQKKLESIEAIDRYFFRPLLKEINLDQTIICVTADHATSCLIKAHSADPVPLLICGPGFKSDGIINFSEKSCQAGSIGTIKGVEIMPRLAKAAKA